MHALALLCINQHTRLEVTSFTNSKDMIGTKFKKNGSRDPDHARYWIVCHPKASTLCILPATKFGDSRFSRSGDMNAGAKTENGSCDPDHAPFRGGLSSVARI